MKILTVDSSLIRRIAYCNKCKTLIVKFINKGVYEYYNVPKELFDGFMYTHDTNESIGSYFHKYIKDDYDYKCLVADKESTNKYNMKSHVCANSISSSTTKKSKSKVKKMVVYEYRGELYEHEEEALMQEEIYTDREKRVEFLTSIGFTEDIANQIYNHTEDIKTILS